MDIAYYISDLLGQQGELTVPNLGYFVQIRMAAHYDNQAKKFFPPHYSVQFDPQIIDEDDSLANYITGVKNISLASAKYFIEKYIANLKSQAVVEDVPFANLGSFSSDGLKLTFASTTKMDDPAFFAFRPLDVYKISDTKSKKPAGKTDFLTQPSALTPPPVPPSVPPPVPQPVAAPVVVEPEPESEEETTEEEYYEEEPRRRFGIWIILLIVITLIVIGLGALYKFRPDIFNKYLPIHKTPVPAQPVPVAKPDTVAGIATDSLAKQDSLKKDSIPVKIDTPKTTIKKPEPAKPEITKPVVTETKKPAPVVVAPPVNTPTANPALSTGDMPAVIPKGWSVITAGAFPIKSIGDKQLVNMKTRGFAQARYLSEKVGRGGNYIVILGAYPTTKEALDGIKELKATGKITEREMSIREIR